ncbi:hypothetical protein ACWNT8_15880 (plasmid) [Pigmentibacter ruber]|nr:hypothetical protein GTC16762_33210 [Pigmentibacter ruber]
MSGLGKQYIANILNNGSKIGTTRSPNPNYNLTILCKEKALKKINELSEAIVELEKFVIKCDEIIKEIK